MSNPMEFSSRRRRRCYHGTLCPSGGVIHPGELAIRVAQHRYVHAVDGRVIADILRSFSAQVDPFVTAMKEFGRNLVRAFEPFIAAMARIGDMVPTDDPPLVLPSGFELVDLHHFGPQTFRRRLADIPTVHMARGSGLPNPDATRVAALADEEIAAWREILDGARSDG